jgi:CHAT domain-containing protein
MNRKMKDVNSKRGFLNRQAVPLFEAAISSALDVANKTGNKEYINEAFMLSERSKSMLMADAMQGVMASTLGGIPDSLLRKLDALHEELSDAEKKRFEAKSAGDAEAEKEIEALVFDCKHHLNLLEHSLEAQYPKYKTLKMKSSVASVPDIQAALSPTTTFIEYFEGENDIYAFVITKNEVSVEVIPKEDDFKLNIFSFQKSLMDIKAFTKRPGIVYNAFIKKSYFFYQKLVQHAIKENRKTERLIIVPDGQLGYLPFEVLIKKPMTLLKQGTNVGADFSKLPYLVRDYKISYNYSGTLLIAQQAKKENTVNGNILALAPSYASTNTPNWREKREVNLRKTLIELPGAVDEVAKLEELYNGQFFTDLQANETVFKEQAPKHGILHLAMHGLVDQEDPEYSGLALTEDQSKEEDNFLYAYEIKQLGLQAGLVVLSACETGVGKYQRGEGVVSIGRGFMYAGAPSLLMTLWSLNDQSGAAIIEQFYKNLSEGMEKDEAIRQAKLFYLDNYPSGYTHPFMWAAFVQVGDYSSIQINRKSNWNYYIIGAVAFLSILLLVLLKTRKKT